MTGLAIPVKQLFQAKTRLSSLCTPAERQQLCLSMLQHMLRVAEACPSLALAAVVSPDSGLEGFLKHAFPAVRFLREAGDLNQAASTAARALAEAGCSSMLFALGDLPLLTSGELERALDAGRDHPVVLLPDRRGSGTNGIVLSPPDCFPAFSFGPGSLAAHWKAARSLGLAPVQLSLRGFAWDIDTPEDLSEAITTNRFKRILQI